MAEVASQIDHAHPLVALDEPDRAGERVVGRAVVDEHDFVVLGQLGGGTAGATVELIEEGAGLVQRGDDRQQHGQKLNMYRVASGP